MNNLMLRPLYELCLPGFICFDNAGLYLGARDVKPTRTVYANDAKEAKRIYARQMGIPLSRVGGGMPAR